MPPEFRFAIKASRRITHQKRLHACDDDIAYMYSVLEPLEGRLGATLFQCAPHLRKNLELLQHFLSSLPAHAKPVLELRHASWFCDEIYDVLREHGAVLCVTDYDKDREPSPLVATTGWGYARLRAEDYSDEELRRWFARLREHWGTAYVFFKHEETAPELVERLVLAGEGS